MEKKIDSDFLSELFRLGVHDNYVLNIIANHLKPNWFSNDAQKEFFEELVRQFKKENRKPTFGTLKVSLRKNKDVIDYINEIQDTKLQDVDSIITTLEQYIKQNMFVEMFNDVGDTYNKGELNKAFNSFKISADKIYQFNLRSDMFEHVFKDFSKRQTKRIIENSKHTNKYPTGIDQFDMITHGGPEPTELLMLMAEAKGTKSFALRHFGVNYAKRGLGVLHFQLEGTRRQCLVGYDSNWTGALYHDIKTGEIDDKIYNSYQKIISNIGKGDIGVYAPERFSSFSIEEMRRMIIDEKKKKNIHVVIIDYADLLLPDNEKYNPGDERLKQRKVVRKLKDLAIELNVLIITATQASSISSELLNDPDFVIKRENLGEDKGKVQPVDYLISINRTIDERKKGYARLYIDAAREYASDEIIYICQSLKHGRFYDRLKTINEFFTDAA